jgi:predicted protein tyrosine phosphatase
LIVADLLFNKSFNIKLLSHLLFICSKNQWRSPTAETLFKNHPLHEAKSAGTSAKARIKVSQKLLEWATIIFMMEQKHKDIIKENFPSVIKNKQVIVLDIADDYTYGDEELVGILQNALTEYL